MKFSLEDPIPPDGIRILDGVIVAVGAGPTAPVEGEMLVEKETFPEKRLYVLTVTVEVADWPPTRARLLGLALNAQSEGVFEILHAVSECSSQPEKL